MVIFCLCNKILISGSIEEINSVKGQKCPRAHLSYLPPPQTSLLASSTPTADNILTPPTATSNELGTGMGGQLGAGGGGVRRWRPRRRPRRSFATNRTHGVEMKKRKRRGSGTSTAAHARPHAPLQRLSSDLAVKGGREREKRAIWSCHLKK